jgi:hypothetical protein
MPVTVRVTIFIVYGGIDVVVYLDGKSERRMTPGRCGRRKFLTLKKRTQITTQYQPRQGGARKNIFFKNGEKPKIQKPMERAESISKTTFLTGKFFGIFIFRISPARALGVHREGVPGGQVLLKIKLI